MCTPAGAETSRQWPGSTDSCLASGTPAASSVVGVVATSHQWHASYVYLPCRRRGGNLTRARARLAFVLSFLEVLQYDTSMADHLRDSAALVLPPIKSPRAWKVPPGERWARNCHRASGQVSAATQTILLPQRGRSCHGQISAATERTLLPQRGLNCHGHALGH